MARVLWGGLAVAAALATTGAGAEPIGFACTAAGVEALVPSLSPEAACARVQRAIDAALGERTVATSTADAAKRWVRVDMRLKRGTLAAQVSDRLTGAVRRLPTFSHSTMDKPPGPEAVDAVAGLAAESLSRS